jgi:hypothetical protein
VKIGILILVLISSLFFIQPIYAGTQYTVDLDALKGMSDDAKAEYIKGLVKQYTDNKATSVLPKVTSDEAKEWATLISGAIKTICNDLSISVNAFLQTDAGKITAFLIAYKIIGQDIKNIVLGTAAWLVITFVLVLMFWFLVVPKKVIALNDQKKISDIRYVPRLDFSREARGTIAGILTAMFTAVTITCLVLVF